MLPHEDRDVFWYMAQFFLVIFIVELVMRCRLIGTQKAFRSHWVKFDAFIIAVSVIDQWIVEGLRQVGYNPVLF